MLLAAFALPPAPDPTCAIGSPVAAQRLRSCHAWGLAWLGLDLATKAAAILWLPSEAPVALSPGLSLHVLSNPGLAGGGSLGPITPLVNLTLAVWMTVGLWQLGGRLLPLDGWAPAALGSVLGGTLGNLWSHLCEPRGVTDFLAVNVGRLSFVCNGADIALWWGTLLLAGVAARLARRALTSPMMSGLASR